MKRILLAAALLIIAPATAIAAPFGEVASRAFDIEEGQFCTAATGDPGGLIRQVGVRPGTGAQFVQAGLGGFTPGLTLEATLGSLCPAVATQPGGAGIVALPVGETESRAPLTIRASLREPGGTWGPLAVVLEAGDAETYSLAAAVSERAEALVALARSPRRTRVEIVTARRAAGGGFAPGETLFSARSSGTTGATVRAGMSASGEAVVAWTFQPRIGARRELWAAVAAPGGPFRAPVRIGRVYGGSSFALAVGAGGHALLAFSTRGTVQVAERPPGGGFGPAAPIGVADDVMGVSPVAAVRADGGAVVAWLGMLEASMHAVVRDRPGPFGAPVTITRRVRLAYPRDLLALSFDEDPDHGNDTVSDSAHTVITGDGRALLAWVAPADRDGVLIGSAQSATLPLVGGAAEAHVHGSGVVDVEESAPVLLEGGTAAVAWTDLSETPSVLHLAVEGAADVPDPPAPRVRVGAPLKRFLEQDEALRLPVTCSSACTVRAQVGEGFLGAVGAVRLTRAGTRRLVIGPVLAPIGRADGRPIRVHLRYAAPGARHGMSRTVLVRVRRPATAPAPRVLGAVARRDADDIVVSWRTNRAASKDQFIAFASAERGSPILRTAEARGGPRRFRARLRNVPEARSVTVFSAGESAASIRRTTLEVRG